MLESEFLEFQERFNKDKYASLNILPSKEQLEKMLDHGLDPSKAIYKLSSLSLKENEIAIGGDPVAVDIKTKYLIEVAYVRMRDFRDIDKFEFMPSAELLTIMLDHGLDPSKAFKFINNHPLLIETELANGADPIALSLQKRSLMEVLYPRITDFSKLADFDKGHFSIYEFEFMPSVELFTQMISNGLRADHAMRMVIRYIEKESDPTQKMLLTEHKEELMLKAIVPMVISGHIDIDHVKFDGIPSDKILDGIALFGQDAIDIVYYKLINYVPNSPEDRQKYYVCKKRLVEVYNANTDYTREKLQQEISKLSPLKLVSQYEEGVTDPVYKKGVIKLDGSKEVVIHFVGTEHSQMQAAAIPNWMKKVIDGSDHLFYEGMCSLRLANLHQMILESGQKYKFDPRDKKLFTKIAQFIKNVVLGKSGEVLEGEIDSLLSFVILTPLLKLMPDSAETHIFRLFANKRSNLEELLEYQLNAKDVRDNSWENIKKVFLKLDEFKKRLDSESEFSKINKIKKEAMEFIADEDIKIPLDYFDENGVMDLSLFHQVLYNFLIGLDLKDLGVATYPVIPKNFVDNIKVSTISLGQAKDHIDHHLLAAGRNKMWVNEIKKIIAQNDSDMKEVVVMSGLAHIPGLIVELHQAGVKFLEDVLYDAYRWVSEVQMSGRVSYEMLLQLNSKLPQEFLDFRHLSQLEEDIWSKYQSDRGLAGEGGDMAMVLVE